MTHGLFAIGEIMKNYYIKGNAAQAAAEVESHLCDIAGKGHIQASPWPEGETTPKLD